MSAGNAFFDTNILLYLYGSDERKRTRAKELFGAYVRSGRVVVSTQVVQEFYAAGSRKLKMPRRELRKAASDLLDLPTVNIAGQHIVSAMEKEEQYRISFWDALIVVAAESAHVEVLYTEDLNDGQRYGSVLVQNPFRST